MASLRGFPQLLGAYQARALASSWVSAGSGAAAATAAAAVGRVSALAGRRFAHAAHTPLGRTAPASCCTPTSAMKSAEQHPTASGGASDAAAAATAAAAVPTPLDQQQQQRPPLLNESALHQMPQPLPTGVKKTFYKRKLPCPPAIEFSSPEGRRVFQEALQAGTMTGFFKLIEQLRWGRLGGGLLGAWIAWGGGRRVEDCSGRGEPGVCCDGEQQS